MPTPAYLSALEQLSQLDSRDTNQLYQMVAACIAIGLIHPEKSMILTGVTNRYICDMRSRRIRRWGGDICHPEYLAMLDRIHGRIDEDRVLQLVPLMSRAVGRIQFFKSLND